MEAVACDVSGHSPGAKLVPPGGRVTATPQPGTRAASFADDTGARHRRCLTRAAGGDGNLVESGAFATRESERRIPGRPGVNR
jgi:hypothetical protein